MTEQEQTTSIEQQEVDYVELIKTYKENSVSKAEYEKVRNDLARMTKAYMEGEHIPAPVEEKKVDPADIANEIATINSSWSNLDVAKKLLEYRQAMVDNGYKDPFLPHGHDVQITQNDYFTAEHFQAKLEECIEKAEGDPTAFVNYFAKNISETALDKIKK